jgi:Zn-dependent protease
LGDDTAWRQGRVSFNPLVHIDPFGTVVLPVMLLMLRSPFMFGYAKPVPVSFRALRQPRLGTILVAAAGPGMNLLLATIAALAFHIVGYARRGFLADIRCANEMSAFGPSVTVVHLGGVFGGK